MAYLQVYVFGRRGAVNPQAISDRGTKPCPPRFATNPGSSHTRATQQGKGGAR